MTLKRRAKAKKKRNAVRRRARFKLIEGRKKDSSPEILNGEFNL